jgi:hypothetical protein
LSIGIVVVCVNGARGVVLGILGCLREVCAHGVSQRVLWLRKRPLATLDSSRSTLRRSRSRSSSQRGCLGTVMAGCCTVFGVDESASLAMFFAETKDIVGFVRFRVAVRTILAAFAVGRKFERTIHQLRCVHGLFLRFEQCWRNLCGVNKAV